MIGARLSSENLTVQLQWLSPKFKTYFVDDTLFVMRETEKAYLLVDSKNQAWVPKSCISEDNALMSEAEANEKADEAGRAIQQDLVMPLKKARGKKWRDLLRLPLLKFQQDVLETLNGKRKVFLFAEQGVGKSPMSLARLVQMDNGLRTLLICEKSLMSQWRSEIDRFCPELQDSIDIINYDVIFRDSRKEFMSQFHDRNFNLILEEVGCLGNENAKRTQKCMELADQAETVQLLTGSMFGGRFEKLYACTRMAGFTWSREEFDKLFTVKIMVKKTIRTKWGTVKKKEPMIVGYKNIDKLVQSMYETGAVFIRAKDCLDLPKMVTQVIEVEQSDKAKRLEKNLYTNLDKIEDDKLTGMFTKLKVEESAGSNQAKLEAIKDLIEFSDHRWVVFYQYDRERDALMKLCKKLKKPVSEVSGHEKDRSAFDKYDNAVMLVNAMSGARGLNLQNANYSIFTSPLDADTHLQAEKRTNRIGQKSTCFYYILKTNGRFETGKLKDLEAKRKDIGAIRSM